MNVDRDELDRLLDQSVPGTIPVSAQVETERRSRSRPRGSPSPAPRGLLSETILDNDDPSAGTTRIISPRSHGGSPRVGSQSRCRTSPPRMVFRIGGMVDYRQSVEFVWRKWDQSAHWRFSTELLGEDSHGHWFGQRKGTRCSRPGADIAAPSNNVLLVPKSGRWIATFYEQDPQDGILVYVDIAARVEWVPVTSEVSGIDMDLDVIKADDARGAWIDDEDEFAARSQALSYPVTEIAETRRVATSILEQVLGGTEPFDGTHEPWLGLMDG